MRRIAVMTLAGLMSVSALGTMAWAQSNETPGVDARQERQQGRIAEGIESGQLTPHEAARLERGEARINRMERRAKADGVVTPKERKRMQGALNRESRAIARQKHDAQSR